jgi:hypothetical protein
MNRSVFTIFCDDIRQEIGGKLSYIGVYNAQMFVPSFPITLPKLCLAMSVITPVDTPFRKLAMRILKDDTQLAEGVLDETQLAGAVQAFADVPEDERKERVQVLQSMFVFSPFLLEGSCTLRVRVETESGELRGGGLRIEQAPATVAPAR